MLEIENSLKKMEIQYYHGSLKAEQSVREHIIRSEHVCNHARCANSPFQLNEQNVRFRRHILVVSRANSEMKDHPQLVYGLSLFQLC